MTKAIGSLIALFLSTTSFAQPDSFAIRGTLPWHNFLCGPTAWNLEDYREYLDDCKAGGINLVAFHNYSGGGERYANYVEPMVRIQYKNVLPEAGFDNGSTSRWGYLPMKIKDYPFGTAKLFAKNKGDYFGADCSTTAKNVGDRYTKAQALMQAVLKMAHERSIKMAMGIEFGVAPPEYASIRTSPDMYWRAQGSLIYNPFDGNAVGVLHAAIDNIIDTYPGIDYIWLWLHEHTMFSVEARVALESEAMNAWYQQEKHYYAGENENTMFLGAWTQAWIMEAYKYIRKKAPAVKIVVGGWSGEGQMIPLLKGLDKSLPGDIVFSIQNPDQGLEDQPPVLDSIAGHRKVWVMPWLEGDRSLWYPEPRVTILKRQLGKAAASKVDGVVAIHWRTEGIRENFEAYCEQASHKNEKESASGFYRHYFLRNYGPLAADSLGPLIAAMDSSGIWQSLYSPEYFAYRPAWGRLTGKQRELCDSTISLIRLCIEKTKDKNCRANLDWLLANYRFIIYMDQAGRGMEPAWQLRTDVTLGKVDPTKDKDRFTEAGKALDSVPLKELVTTYASRVRSRGELGILSSINQRLVGEYRLLKKFLAKNHADILQPY